jgi:hypothetical protein
MEERVRCLERKVRIGSLLLLASVAANLAPILSPRNAIAADQVLRVQEVHASRVVVESPAGEELGVFEVEPLTRRVNLWMHNAAKDPEAFLRLITGPLPNIVVGDSKAFSGLYSGELNLSWRSPLLDVQLGVSPERYGPTVAVIDAKGRALRMLPSGMQREKVERP